MTPMGRKSKDKAFRLHANTHKNMCENAQRERAQIYADIEGQALTATRYMA